MLMSMHCFAPKRLVTVPQVRTSLFIQFQLQYLYRLVPAVPHVLERQVQLHIVLVNWQEAVVEGVLNAKEQVADGLALGDVLQGTSSTQRIAWHHAHLTQDQLMLCTQSCHPPCASCPVG